MGRCGPAARQRRARQAPGRLARPVRTKAQNGKTRPGLGSVRLGVPAHKQQYAGGIVADGEQEGRIGGEAAGNGRPHRLGGVAGHGDGDGGGFRALLVDGKVRFLQHRIQIQIAVGQRSVVDHGRKVGAGRIIGGFHTQGLQGVVLETYGAGNAPTSDWFLQLMRQTVERGVTVLNVTQCDSGSVEMQLYETGQQLRAAGVISGYDITTEAAVTKLMYVMGKNLTPNYRHELMARPVKGEFTL